VQAINGNFYGTTSVGGTNGEGVIFEITGSGSLTTLYNFCSQTASDDGEYPEAELVQATNGNLYGTTYYGGTNGAGTAFEFTIAGILTTLHSFDSDEGVNPYGGLVQATNGAFYGTTTQGGATNDGTVFSLSVGLGSFVETNPISGTVGIKLTILGSNLAGATSVTFNGTEATFKASRTHTTSTVPTGATTGTVKVVTPKKTLKSNVPFRVRQQ